MESITYLTLPFSRHVLNGMNAAAVQELAANYCELRAHYSCYLMSSCIITQRYSNIPQTVSYKAWQRCRNCMHQRLLDQ